MTQAIQNLIKTGLFTFVQRNGIKGPIKLSFGTDAIFNQGEPTEYRYVSVYIGKHEVTHLVSGLTGFDIYTGKNTGANCSLIIARKRAGDEKDFYKWLQNLISRLADAYGYTDMFDKENYIYLGQRNRRGNYKIA